MAGKGVGWLEDRNTPFPPGFRPRGTRERVIAEALRLVAEEGDAGFSLNEVLRRSGVSKGSFFHHFRDVDALCLACFEQCKGLVEPELDASVYRDVESMLLDFGAETAARTSSRRFFRLLMFFSQRAMTDPRFRRAQVELTEAYQASVARLVLALEPGLAADRVTEAVAFLLIVSQGIATHRVLFEDRALLAQVWPHSVAAALSIMRSDAARTGRG